MEKSIEVDSHADDDDVTDVVVVHTEKGYHVEVEGEVRGTVFPDLSSALLWVNMLAFTPAIGGIVSMRMDDRRVQRVH